MNSSNQTINNLHGEYCARTGFDLVMNYQRERVWAEWLLWNRDTPFTVEDLKTLIAYLRQMIRKGDRNEGALKFTNLIGMPDRFEEDLQLARQWRNNYRRPARSGSTSTAAAAEPAAPVMSEEERAEMVREFAAKKPRPPGSQS